MCADDDEGNPEWRLRNSHYSQTAPEGEPRPGLDNLQVRLDVGGRATRLLLGAYTNNTHTI